MAKKKQRSLLSMQRDKLKRQKAAKAQKQAAGKQLPPKGGSSAGSTKARYQRGVRRDAMAKKQLENFGRALKKTLKQGAAQDKLKKAAKGTRGTGVRTGQAAPGKLAKRPSSAITKSSSGKATTSAGAGKPGPNYGKGPRGMRTRLPQGKKGGALAKTSRATGVLNAIAIGATLGEAYKKSNRVKAESGRGAGRKTFNEKSKSKPSSTAKSKPSSTSKPKKRGMSNIPPAEGLVNNPNYGKKASKSPTKASKPSKGVSTPKAKSKPSVAPSRAVSSTAKPKASSGKNAYRAPQGAERKDKASKAVKELRGMIKASKARQNAQMPKKPAAKQKLSRNEQNRRRRQGR